ncbi:BTAD domain-containing putative transcriptional regulator [Ornithinimicrobium cerasi]|uniref:DNA-binding transcriptional activator of the SARP family n=1 Tax=Ornithinimicrobium cerasi TaxID=2248773 RepID=A0A285VLX2_9MICO|nr:BTAD domain-containing putative transcriptional regulator [Ornithinimicrobium cerasi]SOC53571.1 DNA-binding transcriptional activator of the SARP family [Ornithinimicrobium cerasi]
MDIRVLGPVAVGGDAETLGRRDRVVLAALAVRRGEVVSADALADALWEQEPPPSWAKVVQGCISRLRRALGPGAIETHGQGYRLALPAEQVDAARFERLVVRARELLDLGEPDRAAYAVEDALGLWGGGRPWPELEAWEPAEVEAQRLEELRLSAEELRVDAALRAGRVQQILGEAQRLVKQAPLREHRWTALALALYQSGRQAEALEVIRRARRVLDDELGVDPGAELVATEQAILRQDPSLVADVLPQATAVCPYQGLVPYGIEDAESFFGRGVQIREGMARLAEAGTLAVVGPSGSGKSSLVRAGVAAGLERAGRTVVIITPGAAPLDALSAVPAHGAPVLVVDQCEEVVTLCSDEEERAVFLRAVAAHAERAPVVVALRADKLGEFTKHPEFARLVERGLYLLSAMDAAGLREAIEAPARQAGLLFEPGLVDLLVREVEGEPGSLPLLSHALRQTWLRREGSTLTVAGYQATGGIRGAVAQTADSVYDKAPEEERRILRDLLLRLVAPTPEGEPVRSRVPRRSVATDEAHEQMIETLVRARLLTSDEDVVEMAHESLARAWPRLREWLVDDVEGQRVWRHLTLTADAWEGMGRPDSELYRGVRLARAVEWRDRSGTDLNAVEREFLVASETAYRSELDRERAEATRQARVNRRLRGLVAVVAALALVAATVGAFAVREAGRADEQADVAEQRALEARAHELAASAVGAIDSDPSLAKLLAVSAATTAPMGLQATSALHRVWAADATTSRDTLPWGETGWVALHPDGRLLARSGMWWDTGARTLEMVDTTTDEELWSFDLPAGPRYDNASVIYPSFSADGSLLTGGVVWEPERVGAPGRDRGQDEQPPADFLGGYLWSVETGEVVERIDLGPCGGVVVDISEPSLLALRSRDGAETGCAYFYANRDGSGAEVVHVDRRTGEQTVIGEGPTYAVANAALSDDGQVAAYSTDGSPSTMTVVDLASGDQLLREEISVPELWDISGDGSLVLASHEPVEVWDVATGERLVTYDGHGTLVQFARFVPGTETVVSTGNDGAMRRWDARTGRELSVHPGVGNGAVSASGSGMVAVGRTSDAGVAIVDTMPRGEVALVRTCPSFAFADSLQASMEGDVAMWGYVCEGGDETFTQAWRPSTGETLFTMAGHQGQVTAVSPDGTRWVRQDGEGVARMGVETPAVIGPPVVRDVRTGDAETQLQGVCTYVNQSDLADCATFPETPFAVWSWRYRWSPDGRFIALANDGPEAGDGGFAVWDAETGALLHAAHAVEEEIDAEARVRDVHFTPDSTQLLVTTHDGRLVRVSTSTWEAVPGAQVPGPRVGIMGYTADPLSLVAIDNYRSQSFGARLHWLDPDTLQVTRTVSNLHDGTLRAGAIDSTGTRIATVGSEGLARVWDLSTGALVHEVPFGDQQLQGVAWVGENHLAVTPRDGGLHVVTVDPQELLDLVRSSLTRGYTETECAAHGFGDACPTLGKMRGPDATEDDPSELAGTFALSWSPEELQRTFEEGMEEELSVSREPAAAEEVVARAEELAGELTITFEDGVYEVLRQGANEPVCAGSYSLRDGVLSLGAERGRCSPYTFFEASYRLDGDRLHLGEESFVGPWWERLTWTTRPLERVSG